MTITPLEHSLVTLKNLLTNAASWGIDMSLMPHHRKEYHDRAISDEVLKENEVFSFPATEWQTANGLQTVQLFGSLIGQDIHPSWGPSRVIPSRNEKGELNGCFLRHDNPRYTRKKPEEPRYRENMIGVKPPIYAPKGSWELIYNLQAELIIITESAEKALALLTAGYKTVLATNGVWGWKGDRKEKSYVLHPQLQDIVWVGRTVLIIFDSDSVENKDVAAAEARLKKAIERRCERQIHDLKGGEMVQVVIVNIPPLADGDKQGVDDFLAAHGAEALHDRVDESLKGANPARPHISSVENKDRATKYGEHLVAKNMRMVYWNGYWVNAANQHRYVLKSEQEAIDAVTPWLEEILSGVEPHHSAKLLGSYRPRIRIPSDSVVPFWLDGNPPEGFEDQNECPVLADGTLVNLRTGMATQRTKDLFNTCVWPINYDPEAPEPKLWNGLLRDVFKHDYQITTFLRFIAYSLTPATYLQKVLMIIGNPGCGKGTLSRVLDGLFGSDQVFSPSLTDLSDKFGLWDAPGKGLCIIRDMHEAKLNGDGRLMDRLTSISGEEPVRIEAKVVTNPYDVFLTCKIIMFGNKLPALPDGQCAMKRRLKGTILQAYSRDPSKPLVEGLSEKILKEEKSGIFNQLMREYQLLQTEGLPEHPEDAPGRVLLESQQRLGSPMLSFIEDQLLIVGDVLTVGGTRAWVSYKELYISYTIDCEVKNIRPLSLGMFSVELLSVLQAEHQHHNIKEARESRQIAKNPNSRARGVAGVLVRVTVREEPSQGCEGIAELVEQAGK